MAIITKILGLEVTVHINNQAVVEYDDPKARQMVHEKNNLVSRKLIQCEDNALFEIHLKVTEEYDWNTYKDHLLLFNVLIDGNRVAGGLYSKSHANSTNQHVNIDRYMYKDSDGQLMSQRFKFTSITKVDDKDENQYTGDAYKVRRMGTIQVKCLRVLPLSSDKPAAGNAIRNDLTISKNMLNGRAVSHGIEFSAPEKMEMKPSDNALTKFVTEVKFFGVNFIFSYLSKEALIEQGITTRPKSLPGTQLGKETQDISLAGLTQEQIETLATERLREIRKTASILKRKREEEDSEQERKMVNREDAQATHMAGSSTQHRTSTTADGREVIELGENE
ncbi:hypothetical protein F5B19DRAFT_134156 [Rostrohypoxylon terebratum]|nr:hypothetical protein F5B19DRAFT_134156 [Rostrohypoxylon terebratum]